MVKALVWGTREPGFKSRRPDLVSIVSELFVAVFLSDPAASLSL